MRRTLALAVAAGLAGCGGGPTPGTPVPEGAGTGDAPSAGGGGAGLISTEEALAWEALPFDARLAYGPAPQQFGKLRLPEGPGPWPVAVVLHGGCWLSLADHTYMDGVARALTEAGWATWNVELRAMDQEGGGWPGTLQDAAAGLDHLRVVAAEHPLDLRRVVTVGHSSGGHLALWAASRHRIAPGAPLHDPDPLPVRGVVSLAGMADLEHYQALEIGWDDGCGDAAARLLGGPPSDVPERVAQASPPALWATGVPQLLLTGERDRAVPPVIGESYAARARAAGQPATHHLVPGAGHFELVAPWTGAWREAWSHIEPFLARTAGG